MSTRDGNLGDKGIYWRVRLGAYDARKAAAKVLGAVARGGAEGLAQGEAALTYANERQAF